MKKTMVLAALAVVTGCISEVGAIFQQDSTVHFKVVDYNGNAISNASVRVNTFKKWIPGECFGRDVMMDNYGNTDTNGEVDITFLCKSMNFSYSAGKNGYYGDGGGIGFARAGSGFTLRQTQFETNLVVLLKPIINPCKMFVFRMSSGLGKSLKYPQGSHNGTWGFDLKEGDWIAPHGKGVVADFFVEYSDSHFAEDKILDCALVFTNAAHDGCYVAKCTGTSFRSGYAADAKAKYMKRLDFDSWGKKFKGKFAAELLDADEYLVIRSRTKCDDNGNIVSANYAKIYGPITFFLGMTFTSYFNPNENDPNLEADTTVNLMPDGEMGFAP